MCVWFDMEGTDPFALMLFIAKRVNDEWVFLLFLYFMFIAIVVIYMYCSYTESEKASAVTKVSGCINMGTCFEREDLSLCLCRFATALILRLLVPQDLCCVLKSESFCVCVCVCVCVFVCVFVCRHVCIHVIMFFAFCFSLVLLLFFYVGSILLHEARPR